MIWTEGSTTWGANSTAATGAGAVSFLRLLWVKLSEWDPVDGLDPITRLDDISLQ